ncbi:MAG: UDP-N-acetyl-D-mannosamine dehydrogenase [Arsenophonus sp.]
MSFETISIIGLGYIGLPTAAIFAAHHKKVIGVDINQYTVDAINKVKINIFEPNLYKIVKVAVETGYLKAFTRPQCADVFLIAVPTPLKDDHKPDLSYIMKAAESIALLLKKGDLIILESTSPIGTTEKMADQLAIIRSDLTFPQHNGENSDIDIAYCPERVLPGKVMLELIKNDRVIGGMTMKSSQRAIKLYKIFLSGECVITNTKTAEMSKLIENSFRDVNIAFANELSFICCEHGINVLELISLANRHPRVNILEPGPGVGGHCIPIDPWFIIDQNPKQSHLIHTARLINDSKPIWVVDQVKTALINYLTKTNKLLNKIKIACFGLTFKPDTNDLRGSPAIQIIKMISDWHIDTTYVIEPNINKLPKSLNGLCKLVSSEVAIANADIILLLVYHKEFKLINRKQIQQKCIFDTKGVWR